MECPGNWYESDTAKDAPGPGRIGQATRLPALLSIISAAAGRVCRTSALPLVGLSLFVLYAQASAHAEVERISDLLHANFTADGTRPPGLGDLSDIRTGDEPFSGNCVHFALAGYYQLEQAGLDPVLVAVTGRHRGRKYWHLLACSQKADLCLDNESLEPYTGREILERYQTIERVFVLQDDVFDQRN